MQRGCWRSRAPQSEPPRVLHRSKALRSKESIHPKQLSKEENMALQVRRVVNGHDENGRAIVKIDEISKNVGASRPGQSACVVWTTESFPVNNTGESDEGLRKVGTTLNNGTVFRIVEFG